MQYGFRTHAALNGQEFGQIECKSALIYHTNYMITVVGPRVSEKSLKVINYSRIKCETIRTDYVVQIFFSEIKYTYIEAQEAYTIMALLCDIGGSLGLILGGTMLTLCEFGDFLITLAVSCLKVHFMHHRRR